MFCYKEAIGDMRSDSTLKIASRTSLFILHTVSGKLSGKCWCLIDIFFIIYIIRFKNNIITTEIKMFQYFVLVRYNQALSAI